MRKVTQLADLLAYTKRVVDMYAASGKKAQQIIIHSITLKSVEGISRGPNGYLQGVAVIQVSNEVVFTPPHATEIITMNVPLQEPTSCKEESLFKQQIAQIVAEMNHQIEIADVETTFPNYPYVTFKIGEKFTSSSQEGKSIIQLTEPYLQHAMNHPRTAKLLQHFKDIHYEKYLTSKGFSVLATIPNQFPLWTKDYPRGVTAIFTPSIILYIQYNHVVKYINLNTKTIGEALEELHSVGDTELAKIVVASNLRQNMPQTLTT